MLRNPKTLKAAARDSLGSAGYDPKKLALIYSGATLLLSLLVMLVDYLLAQELSATVGLGGMDKRAALETAQSLLQLTPLFLLPLWQAGFTFAALKLARSESAKPTHLLEGFHRFGSLLRLMLLQGALLFGLIMVCCYAAAFVFMVTPWGKDMMAELSILAESGALLDDPALLEEAIASLISQQVLPLVLIVIGLMLVILVPVFYRLRFAQHAIMDGERSAMMAMRFSRRYTKGNCLKLLKLDFSFWWYYLASFALGLVFYSSELLRLAGVPLPWSAGVGYGVSTGLYMLGLLALNYHCLCYIEITYAQAYYELKPHEVQVI